VKNLKIWLVNWKMIDRLNINACMVSLKFGVQILEYCINLSEFTC